MGTTEQTTVPAEGPRADRIIMLGSVLSDRTGATWVVKRLTRAFVWVNTYPEPFGEEAIPFSWPVVNALEVASHRSKETHSA